MEEQRNTTNDRVAIAEKAYQDAAAAVESSSAAVESARAAVDSANGRWNTWLDSNPNFEGNGEPFLFKALRDSREALKEREEALKESRDALKEREDFLKKSLAELKEREEKFQTEQGTLETFSETNRKRYLWEISEDIKNPSSFAKSSGKHGWYEILKNYEDQIYTYRLRVDGRCPPPITLLCQYFAEFIDNCQSIQYGNKDCEFVQDFCFAMTAKYTGEKEMAEKARKLLTDYFDIEVAVATTNDSISDGSIRVKKRLIFNMEIKLQKGDGGGDPMMQNLGYYFKHLPVDTPLNRQLPCFVVDICGPLLSVHGIVCMDCKSLVTEPLIPSWPLQFVDNPILMNGLIRVCASLKRAIEQLESLSNENVSSEDGNSFVAGRFCFPYPDQIMFRGTSQKLRYLERLTDGDVYAAEMIPIKTKAIVKFAKSYGLGMHQYLAGLGFAPELYYHEALHGGWHLIVMERINLDSVHAGLNSDSATVRQNITALEKILRSNNYVHGDLRPSNIMWNVDSKQIMVIDFDWAGIDNQDTYPPFMNLDIDWPDGAESGKPLRREHDEFWIQRLKDKLMEYE